jgi:hypothetical protein
MGFLSIFNLLLFRHIDDRTGSIVDLNQFSGSCRINAASGDWWSATTFCYKLAPRSAEANMSPRAASRRYRGAESRGARMR